MASLPVSRGRAATPPVLPTALHRWGASGWNCSRSSHLASSGSRSCSTPPPLPAGDPTSWYRLRPQLLRLPLSRLRCPCTALPTSSLRLPRSGASPAAALSLCRTISPPSIARWSSRRPPSRECRPSIQYVTSQPMAASLHMAPISSTCIGARHSMSTESPGEEDMADRFTLAQQRDAERSAIPSAYGDIPNIVFRIR